MIKRQTIWLLTFVLILGCISNNNLSLMQAAQDDEDRRVWDSDFLQKRPKSKSGSKVADSKIKYKKIASANKLVDKAAVKNNSEEPNQASIIGVTLWKLRPAKQTEDKDIARILDRVEDTKVQLVAERLSIDTLLVEGQKVRLTVEVPRAGYLYVVDREKYKDGTYGDPYLIFPIKLANGIENNEVKAGLPKEIPSQEAEHPYFNVSLNPSRKDNIGEELTIIVSPKPIAGLNIGTKILKLSKEQVDKWEKEWGAKVDILELVGGEGQLYKEQEKLAASGTELSQDDPLPQTLYKVYRKDSEPVMVQLPLKVNK